MRYLVLGHLEVSGVNGPIALGSPKERRLLSVLVAHRGETMTADELVSAVWDGAAPRSAAKTLQGYVVHIRQALEAGGAGPATPIVTRPSGYALEVPRCDVDADLFRDLSDRGRRAVEDQDFGTASVLLEEALSMWRGAPYADFPFADFANVESRNLEELRLLALEALIDAELAMGAGAELVPRLEALVSAHATREHLWVQLVRALHRAGRQADALEAYQRARSFLVDELGVEPGADLQAVQLAVLAQDPALDVVHSVDREALPGHLPLAGPSFEGRDADLAWLRHHWAAAVAGRGAVVVISGQEGVGKSRLLAELGREVHARGGVVRYDAASRSPSPSDLVDASGGRPVLLLLDEPLTAIGPPTVTGLPLMVVAALDQTHAPCHVEAGFRGADHREIKPFPDEVARRVVARYVGVDHSSIDIEQVIRTADGRPGALHELIASEVERVAEARIGAASKAAGIARASLGVERAELRAGILGLQRARAQLGANASSGSWSSARSRRMTCPYKGLAPFEREDSALFYGRDSLLATLLARVSDTPLVAVVGASGSGKSSLVRAGLLASLADGSLPGSAQWKQHLLLPGAALPSSGARSAVIVVDQFEEVWTVLAEEARAAYLDELVSRVESGDHVVVTLRAEYVDRCAEHEGLGSLVGDGTLLVAPLTDLEVRRAVLGPAEVFGLVVDDGLVEQIVQDVRAQPGGLPLMSAALVDTWEGRSGRRLTMAAYTRSGGVAGAVARMAETTFASLTESEREAVRRLFLRLASSGDGESLARRRAPLAELEGDPDTVKSMHAMSERRLLSVDAEIVEVSHEALFWAWPRLAQWLRDDKQGRTLRKHLAPAALEWDRGQRAPSDLYRGVRLNAVLEWVRSERADLSHLEREFVAASVEESERELRQQQERAERESKARARLRVLTGVIAISLVLAAVFAVVAVNQRRHSEDVARHAVSRQLGSASLVEDTLDRSLLLAVAGLRLDDSLEARGDLLAALQRSPAALAVLHGSGNKLQDLDLSADGTTLVAGDNTGTLLTWDARSREEGPHVQVSEHGFVDIAARPGTDEFVLSSLGSGGPQLPLLRRWDAARQEQVGPDMTGADSPLGPLAWSPDGRWLAGNQDAGDVLVWDFDHLGRPPIHIPTDHARFRQIAYAGGRTFLLVEESGSASVWLPGDARPIRRFDVGDAVSALASSADGSVVAVGHADGQVALWDTASGRLRHRLTAHGAAVHAIVFDRQGRRVATLGDDRNAVLSEVASGRHLETMAGHAGAVLAGAFTTDGRTLYTASSDGSVIAWDVTGERRLGAFFPGSRGVDSSWTTVSDADVVAVTHADGTVRFWDAITRRPLGVAVKGDQEGIIAASFSPGGAQLATAGLGGTVQLWDVDARSPGLMLRGLPGDANEIAFSPDGRLLAVCVWQPGEGTIHLFDAVSKRQLGEPIDVGWGMTQLAWSSDSTRIAVASWEVPDVRVYDARTRALVWGRQVADGWYSESVAFSPDGARVATGDELGRLQFWDAASGRPEGTPLEGHAGQIVTTAYSPDGEWLATAGTDGKVILWDADTGKQIGPALHASDNRYTVARFAGDTLVVGSDDGSVWRWEIDAEAWRRRACAVAARDLSPSEWAALATGQDYEPTCR